MPYSNRQLDWTTPFEALTRSYLFSETTSFRFTTDRGALHTHNFKVGDEDVSLSRVFSTGHEIELTEMARASMILPTSGTIQVRLGDNEFTASRSEALVFRPNHRRTRVIADPGRPYSAYVVLVPPNVLGVEAAPYLHDSMLPSATPWLRELEHHLRLVFSDTLLSHPASLSGPASAEYVVDLFRRVIGSSNSAKIESEMRGGVRVQSRAEDFIRANFAQPLTMADIADSAGVSVRRLQIVFRSVAGCTPRSALNLARMEAAHDLLNTTDEDLSVTQIAYDCGFSHLSRFAAAYRARYGQSPSRTLRTKVLRVV